MSGGEPSSIKQNLGCAAGMPDLSRCIRETGRHRSQREVRGCTERRFPMMQRMQDGQFRLPVFQYPGREETERCTRRCIENGARRRLRMSWVRNILRIRCVRSSRRDICPMPTCSPERAAPEKPPVRRSSRGRSTALICRTETRAERVRPAAVLRTAAFWMWSRSTRHPTTAWTTSAISAMRRGTHRRRYPSVCISSTRCTCCLRARSTHCSRHWRSRRPMCCLFWRRPRSTRCRRRFCRGASALISGGLRRTTFSADCRRLRRRSISH